MKKNTAAQVYDRDPTPLKDRGSSSEKGNKGRKRKKKEEKRKILKLRESSRPNGEKSSQESVTAAQTADMKVNDATPKQSLEVSKSIYELFMGLTL